MVDVVEVAGRTDKVASAMRNARAVLKRAQSLLSNEQIDSALTLRLSDVDALGATSRRVAEAEGPAETTRRRALETRDHADVERSHEAELALRSAFSESTHEAGIVAGRLTDSCSQLIGLRDDLVQSAQQLRVALAEADALHRLPEYGGSQQTLDLQDKVRGIHDLTKDAEKGVAEAADLLEAARLRASQFQRSTPEGSQSSGAVRSTTQSLMNEISTAQRVLRDVHRKVEPRSTETYTSTEYAIAAANAAAEANKAETGKAAVVDNAAAKKVAEGMQGDLAKTLDVATNPTAAADLQPAGSAQQELRRRLDGPAQDSGVQR